MAKTKSAFFCQQCGYESAKWLGKCPSCNSWNSFVEELVQKENKPSVSYLEETIKGNKTQNIADVSSILEKRLITPDTELNRVLGGGIVEGSV